ncbi:MAG: hypothetical protein ACHQJ6_06360, partial [Candidatus Berkiellales bacterium]
GYGWVAMLDLLATAMYGLSFVVGASTMWRDIANGYKKPHLLMQHLGKIFGGMNGRKLAYMAPGVVSGHLGPAVGYVASHGVTSTFLSGIFQHQGWFLFQVGSLNPFTAGMLSTFNSVLTSVFFTHRMRLQGDFYGEIGPSPTQIYNSTLFGIFLGYQLERFVGKIYEHIALDVGLLFTKLSNNRSMSRITPVMSGAIQGLNSLYAARKKIGYSLGFVSVVTPIILFITPPGVALIALAGSKIGASFIIGSSLLGVLGAVFGIIKLGRRCLFGREVEPEPVPDPHNLTGSTTPTATAATASVIRPEKTMTKQYDAQKARVEAGVQPQGAPQPQPRVPPRVAGETVEPAGGKPARTRRAEAM